MSEDHILSPSSINFKEGTIVHPTYQFLRVTPQEGILYTQQQQVVKVLFR